MFIFVDRESGQIDLKISNFELNISYFLEKRTEFPGN